MLDALSASTYKNQEFFEVDLLPKCPKLTKHQHCIMVFYKLGNGKHDNAFVFFLGTLQNSKHD
jgi:hypothetical protein